MRNACWRKPSCRAAEINMPRMMSRLTGAARTRSRPRPFTLESHLQIARRDRRVGCQCRRCARPHDLPLSMIACRGLVVDAEAAVPRTRHQPRELRLADVNERRVIAALEIDVGLRL